MKSGWSFVVVKQNYDMGRMSKFTSAIEAIKENETIAELSKQFEVVPMEDHQMKGRVYFECSTGFRETNRQQESA